MMMFVILGAILHSHVPWKTLETMLEADQCSLVGGFNSVLQHVAMENGPL